MVEIFKFILQRALSPHFYFSILKRDEIIRINLLEKGLIAKFH